MKTEYRDELIVHYLPLVKTAVGRIASTYPPHVKLDDLYSSGVTGLIKAVEKYDPHRPARFESYAMLLIKGAVIDELRDLDWVPRSIHQKANWVQSAQTALQQELGRDPTDEELAHHLGITEEEFKEIVDRIRPAVLIPLNADSNHSDEEKAVPLAERIADPDAPTSFAVADKNEFCRLLEKEISTLSKKEQTVLMLYYFDEYMLKEIGKVLGVSESRVSQIHTQALIKLRGRLENRLMTK